MTGTRISTINNEGIEVDGDEKLSFSKFLVGKNERTVNLERILGIGGEGIVLAHKMDTKENHYKARKDLFERPEVVFIEEKGRDVALKFVELEKNHDENFSGPEEQDKFQDYGGINVNGKWVESPYFRRLDKQGDFRAATHVYGGYCRPYIDFGISEIHQKYYYVIG